MRQVSSRHLAVWIFLIAIIVRITLIFALGSYKNFERTEVINVAISLAEKGQFADAYGPGTGPTAHTAPIYPILLSFIFRIFGTGITGEIAQEIFSSAIASIICALMPAVAVAFDLASSVGVAAGFCLALLPVNFWSETKGSFESALCALALVCLCWYSALVWKRRKFTAGEAAIGGAIAGFAFLVSPSLLPVVALLLLAGLPLFRDKIGAYFRYAVVFAVITVLMVTPWAIRNQRSLGALIFTRSNFGLELSVSNNDYSHVEHEDNFADTRVHRVHPFVDSQARAEEMRVGEVAFSHERRQEATTWIESHPAKFLELTAGRAVLFWFPRMHRAPQTILIRLEALAGIIGFILLCRTPIQSKWIFASVWIGYPLVYYLVQAFPRYRYPIDWTFVLLASFGLLRLLPWK